MRLSNGERERLKSMFNLFLAAQRRCSETTEIGRTKKAIYAAMVVTLGFVLGDDGMFEQNMNKWVQVIKDFGVITDKELNPERNWLIG